MDISLQALAASRGRERVSGGSPLLPPSYIALLSVCVVMPFPENAHNAACVIPRVFRECVCPVVQETDSHERRLRLARLAR